MWRYMNMRTALISVLIVLCLPVCGHSEATLGGLHTDDNLAAIWKAMDMPEMIQARRRNGPETDQSVLIYQRQGGSVYLGLTPQGDRLEHMLSESPAMVTNDGIKVGDPRASMVSKRGEPEETTRDQPGITECWYWSQGINFAVENESGRIANIFIFPPQASGPDTHSIAVPDGNLQISHEYRDSARQGSIVGRVSNKSGKPQRNVRIGITLYDKERRVVDVLVSEVGSLMPGGAFPFRAEVQRKGIWTDYSVDCLAATLDAERSKQNNKIDKLSLTGKKIIVIPVADATKPK